MRPLKFGVEVEFFGCSIDSAIESLRNAGVKVADYEGYTHRVKPEWKITTDASVTRQGTLCGCGLELVSPILYGADGLKQLKAALKALRDVGAKVDSTCGVHVHHDAEDFTTENIKTVYNVYYGHQDVIDSFLPASRRDGRYCAKLRDIDIERLNNYEGELTADNRYHMPSFLRDRYHKVNFVSYIKYGTIEFRQHSGSLNFTKIRNWILFTFSIMTVAKEKPFVSTDSNESIDHLFSYLTLNGSEIEEYYRRRAC